MKIQMVIKVNGEVLTAEPVEMDDNTTNDNLVDHMMTTLRADSMAFVTASGLIVGLKERSLENAIFFLKKV